MRLVTKAQMTVVKESLVCALVRSRQSLWVRASIFALVFLLSCCAFPSRGLAQPPPPRITMQPMSLIVLEGDPAVFSVGVHDSISPLFYDWRFFGFVHISNGIYSTLVISNAFPGQVGVYSVVVSNTGGSVTSSNATLTVVSGPMPERYCVQPGTNVTFGITVTGYGPVMNQWRRNGQWLPGETNYTLTLRNVQLSDAGAYDVMVRNPAGSVTTRRVFLNVEGGARLWGPGWGPQGFRFHVSGAPNASYLIQGSHDFKNWFEVVTTNAPPDGTFEIIDPDATGFDWRCYRALQQ